MLAPLKPRQIAEGITICVKAKRRFMLHGDPGIGKSQIVQQIADLLFAEVYGYKYDAVLDLVLTAIKGEWVPVPDGFKRPWFRDIRAALLDAVDLRGLPCEKEGKTFWLTPEFLPSDLRGGIFFMDEINRGTEMVMNGLFSLCDKGELGSYTLPATWLPCAAVNDKDIGARKMPSALLARFQHMYCTSEVDDVCRIGVARDWHPAVLAFLRFRPGLLHAYDPKAAVSPNPRAWEFVSDLTKQNMPAHMLLHMIAGSVGEPAAIEYVAFLHLYKQLPSIDAIVNDPSNAEVPSEPSVLWAIAVAVARKATESNFGRIIRYLERMPVEYNVVSVVDALRRNPVLQATAEYTKWAIKHADVLIGAV